MSSSNPFVFAASKGVDKISSAASIRNTKLAAGLPRDFKIDATAFRHLYADFGKKHAKTPHEQELVHQKLGHTKAIHDTTYASKNSMNLVAQTRQFNKTYDMLPGQ